MDGVQTLYLSQMGLWYSLSGNCLSTTVTRPPKGDRVRLYPLLAKSLNHNCEFDQLGDLSESPN